MYLEIRKCNETGLRLTNFEDIKAPGNPCEVIESTKTCNGYVYK